MSVKRLFFFFPKREIIIIMSARVFRGAHVGSNKPLSTITMWESNLECERYLFIVISRILRELCVQWRAGKDPSASVSDTNLLGVPLW